MSLTSLSSLSSPSGSYREHRPSSWLAPYVSCYWTRSSPWSGDNRVLPDGCVDILFKRGEAFVVGAMTRPIVVRADDSAPIVAVRFRPGGAHPFLSIPMGELTDDRVALRDIWRSSERVESVGDLDAMLSRRLSETSLPEPRVAAAISRIEASGGRARVGTLSDVVGCTRQHLNRLFEQHVGVGVKFFCRVVRFQRVIERPRTDWAGVAVDHGFYDQAHLISEFRALAGVTPSQLMKFHFSNTAGLEPDRVSP